MKSFRVLAKNHTAEEAQKLLQLAVEHGAKWLDVIGGHDFEFCYSVQTVVFEIDYSDCYSFGVDSDGETFLSAHENNIDAPLFTYEQAEAHIKASAK